MATTLTELNEAQKLIYTRSSIARAFPEFDDTDIAGIYLNQDNCHVVYKDGASVEYPRQQIKEAYQYSIVSGSILCDIIELSAANTTTLLARFDNETTFKSPGA